jgi:hypothetical protein
MDEAIKSILLRLRVATLISGTDFCFFLKRVFSELSQIDSLYSGENSPSLVESESLFNV